MKQGKRKTTIGRTDCADLPLLKLKEIPIKIDTGAYTSSIHCDTIEEIKKKNKKAIRFVLLDPFHEQYNNRAIETADYEMKTIRNSFGQDEERFVIKTEIVLFNETFEIELSLSNRSDMKYPILIGRKLLADKFVVDVSRTNLSLKLKGK